MKPKKSTLAIFLLPAIVLFLLIYLLPLLLVVCTSFFNWKIGSPIFFSGLENYLKAVQDKNVHAAVGHTLIWVLLQSTVHVFLGTLLAFILAKQFRGWKVFRTVCMLPNVISTAALAMILLNVFKTDSGLLNGIISLITGNKFEWNWYFNSKTAIPSVTLGWLLYPGLITILMLAAINSIPMDLLDAAKIDGASASQINLMIILPMVRNSLGTCVIIAATSMLKEFELIYLTTGGGPGNMTLNLPLYIYKVAFKENNYSYSNALSTMLILFGIIIVFAINRMFRIENPATNVRNIISFINEMVALKQEWGKSISIENIALFCLEKEQILNNPVNEILSG